MSSIIDVFARTEKKYRLDASQYSQLLTLISERLQPGEFAYSTVRSLYFDTAQYQLIERSLEKPLYKEKLRMRVYGDCLLPSTPAFIEIKKKFKGIIYKRRVMLSFEAANAYMQNMPYAEACERFPLQDPLMAKQSLSRKSMQIAREIDFFRTRYAPLMPSMVIACERYAFVDPNSDLRITFDSQLRANDAPQGPSDLMNDEKMHTLIGPGEAVMEIKSSTGLPLWLTQALSNAMAYKQSFTKYGTAYRQMVQAGRNK